jgi:hypothetical protein
LRKTCACNDLVNGYSQADFRLLSSASGNRKSVKTFPNPGMMDVLPVFAESRFIIFLRRHGALANFQFWQFRRFWQSLSMRPAPPLLSSTAPACS